MQTVPEGMIAAGIKLDLRKAFDLVRTEICDHILARLGAPRSILKLWAFFDLHHKKYIEVKGEVFHSPLRPKRGVPQGDPSSPLRFTAIIVAWSAHMSLMVDGVAKAAYLDDRIIMVTGFDPAFKLKAALEANARFERRYALEDNGGKRAGFAQRRSVVKRLQDQFGHPFSSELSFLGVRLGLQGKTPMVDCAAALCKMERRAQRITVLRCALTRKKALVRTMLLSMFLWTAPFQSLDKSMTKATTLVERAL